MKTTKILLSVACVCLTLTACKPKMHDCRGLVTKVESNLDTMKSMTVHTTDGKDIIFNMKNAKYTESVMIEKDSVIVNYIKGRHDTARALVVTVLPKPARYVDIEKLDTTKELLVAPASNDSIKKK